MAAAASSCVCRLMRIWPGSAASASSHCLGFRIPGEPKRPRPSHQRLARRKAEATCQAHAMPPQQNARFGGERASRLQTRPRRPQGIILVHGSDTEDAHQALTGADRQLSSVPLQDRRQARN